MSIEAAVARATAKDDSLLARLAAGIAHELRNPLAVILARVQLLDLAMKNGQRPDSEKITRTIRTIEEQALRASRVIESISAFARPRPPEAQGVDLESLIGTVTSTLARRFAAGPPVELDISVAGQARMLTADPDQLSTALTELITNGFEAVADGGRLRIEATRRDGVVTVVVTDTGRGVATHDAPRIFEPFFSTKPAAAGLGLCVAQTIAEAHGGSVKLLNAGHEGAQFALTVPADRPTA